MSNNNFYYDKSLNLIEKIYLRVDLYDFKIFYKC